MKKNLNKIILTLSMLFMLGQGAMAQCPLVLDQSVTCTDNTWNTGGYYVAQTFTAGTSGNLMKISLKFQSGGSGSIVILNGPDVNGTVFFSAVKLSIQDGMILQFQPCLHLLQDKCTPLK